jgi:signal transduction histidine kinase
VEQALREASRRKDEFLAALAHELRNPLVPIRNALEIMRLTGDSPESVEANRVLIARQVKQMVRLIDDLLDIARITFGTLSLKRENVNLGRIVGQAVENSRAQIEAGRHLLTVSLPTAPTIVSADPTRLVQIIQHLLHNAAKYMDREGKIWLSVEQEDGEVHLRVRDTGFGLPSDMLGEVFEMFTQVSHHREKALGGLGIGLWLVRSLVQLHGGSVEAASPGLGLGTEFTVRLRTE